MFTMYLFFKLLHACTDSPNPNIINTYLLSVFSKCLSTLQFSIHEMYYYSNVIYSIKRHYLIYPICILHVIN